MRNVFKIIVNLKLYKLLKRKAIGFDYGSLRTLNPISSVYGMDRGTPIDRYYIKKFIEKHSALIHGITVEIGDKQYSKLFNSGITESIAAGINNGNEVVYLDLTNPDAEFMDKVDCLIATQVLNFIYDFKKSIHGISKILRKNGTALITLACLEQVSTYDKNEWGDYWRFTPDSAKKMFSEIFEDSNVEIDVYGNLLTVTSILHGLSAEELKQEELNYKDPQYPLIIGVKVVKK